MVIALGTWQKQTHGAYYILRELFCQRNHKSDLQKLITVPPYPPEPVPSESWSMCQ